MIALERLVVAGDDLAVVGGSHGLSSEWLWEMK
jgi:hypothetical protein